MSLKLLWVVTCICLQIYDFSKIVKTLLEDFFPQYYIYIYIYIYIYTNKKFMHPYMDYKEKIWKCSKKGFSQDDVFSLAQIKDGGGLWRLVFVKYGQAKSLHFYLLDFLEDLRPIHLPHNNLPLFFLHVHVTSAATDQ